jgi:hypothetical protein
VPIFLLSLLFGLSMDYQAFQPAPDDTAPEVPRGAVPVGS